MSVRSVAEAEAALAGGAALIDVKEPVRGALGRADDTVIAAVVRAVAGRCPVSAALGELAEEPRVPDVPGLAFAKWGLARMVAADWRPRLAAAVVELRRTLPGCRAVATAYADAARAAAPAPEAVAGFAAEAGCGAFLIDTWRKDGTTLLNWLPVERIAELCRFCEQAGVAVALAGSLTAETIVELRGLLPHWFAVRGAACPDGRGGSVDAGAVRRLVETVKQITSRTGE